MLKKVSLLDDRGQKLEEFSILNDSPSRYLVVKIDGLTPVKGDFNLYDVYGDDGSRVNSVNVGTRDITMVLDLSRYPDQVGESRQRLYSIMNSRTSISLLFEDTDPENNRIIDCYMDTFGSEIFSDSLTITLNFFCPNPYFRSTSQYRRRSRTGESSETTRVLGTAESPFVLTVYGYRLAETYYIGNGVDKPLAINKKMGTGDSLTISTVPGSKRIQYSDVNGVGNNELKSIVSGSLSMMIGGSRAELNVWADDPNIILIYDLTFTPRWVGL